MKKTEINLDGFRDEKPFATKAEKFGREHDPSSGVSGEWFIGSRVVCVRRDDEEKTLVQIGTTKSSAKWIAMQTDRPCSSQKLRRALKNGHRCNGFVVEYKTKS